MAYQRIIVAGQISRSFYYGSIPAHVWLSGDPVPPFSALMLLTAAPAVLFLSCCPPGVSCLFSSHVVSFVDLTHGHCYDPMQHNHFVVPLFTLPRPAETPPSLHSRHVSTRPRSCLTCALRLCTKHRKYHATRTSVHRRGR
ncbi:hypothetical protein HETIRDRAFT_149270 [Heterobasidion irregulare TC 32-1]|uniref:Uncharacterized protein n=1 Tax=Heterobasidion irregulare (strain TC 32-1) TaxID=747525 RepID=W4KI15_HETIT|nr:uncharacterized protein HETIRDRAFT_149270 [Heterobasidion irregulare TC 32-1]ETW84960.1 hypothetical protein HETIRDRAFT_149270 [Heterobasidion irregulare TC 32-1]